jgi:hypothetical protein
MGIPRLARSETSDDNDVSIKVPNNVQWLMESIYVKYVAVNNGSDRQLEIQIHDHEADTVAVFRAGKEQGVNTTRKYMFAPGLTRLTAFYDTDYLTVPLPNDYVLREGWQIRIFDNNGVDATDDMDIQIMVRELDTVSPDTELPATAQRNYAMAPGVEQLTITPTQPVIGVFPIFEPAAAQLTITPTAPTQA